MENIVKTIKNVFRFFWTKVVFSVPAIFFFGEVHLKIITILALILVIDTITGLSKAIKTKTFNSQRMREKLASKLSLYGMAMSTIYLVSCSEESLIWTFQYMGLFFILSEAVSIFENLAELGLVMPKKIIKVLGEKK